MKYKGCREQCSYDFSNTMPGSPAQKVITALNRHDPHNDDPLDDKPRWMLIIREHIKENGTREEE